MIDRVVDERQPPFGELTAVLAVEGEHRHRMFRHRLPHQHEIAFRHGERHKDRLDLRDDNKRRPAARGDQIADIDETQSGNALDWRAHRGIFDIELGSVDLRLIGLYRGGQLLDQRLLRVVLLSGRCQLRLHERG